MRLNGAKIQMVQEQTISAGRNRKIRSAIDSLLTSQSTQVVNSDNIKLTICSPDIEVVMNKQGGICTKYNTMFKSRTSLLGHLEKCGIKLPLMTESQEETKIELPRLKLDIVSPNTVLSGMNNRPKLMIML